MGARPRSPTGKGTFWGNIFGHAQTCNQSAYSTYSALLARDSTCSTAVDKLNVFRHCASVHQAAKLVAALLRFAGGNCGSGGK